MRLLMIYQEKDKKTADQLGSILDRMKIPAESFPVRSDEEDIKQFTGFFSAGGAEGSEQERKDQADVPQIENPTHVFILSALSSQWFDFLAGFSCGSRLPIHIYSTEAAPGISGEFVSFFRFIETEESLRRFLEAEHEAFKKQEAVKKIIRAQETLLKMGVPVTNESMAQCTGEGRIREITFFLAAGFSPDTRNKSGVPLLNIAARNGNRETLQFLLSMEADVNLQAHDRDTSALIDSVMGRHIDLVKDLVAAGANLNIKSKDGQTALIVAVGAGDEAIIEVLLKAGADPDLSDNLGVSARKYAALFNKASIMVLFDTYAPKKV